MRQLWPAAILTTLAVAATVLIPTGAAHADEDSIQFSSGSSHATLGPNQVLRVDGRIRYFNNCSAPANGGGIDDFVYPAADLYLIPTTFTPSDGDELVDESGTPTTIVQAGGTFVDEILAITQPSGSLPEGDYSIVVDTCQNGTFNAASDLVIANAVTVEFPTELPAVDASIVGLKTKAHTQWGRWQEIGKLFDTLLNVDKVAGCGLSPTVSDCLAVLKIWVDSPTIQSWLETTGQLKEKAECLVSVSACFGLLAEYWGLDNTPVRSYVTSGAKNLIANQAKAFFGIYADPPRADFATATSVTQPDLPLPQVQGAGPIFDSVSELATALEREQLMWTALLAAIERYQGAVAAGDAAATVAQARSAANLAEALSSASPVTAELLDEWFTNVHTAIPNFDIIGQQGCGRLQQIGGSGFTAAEDRTLRNWGVADGVRAEWLGSELPDAADNYCHIAAPFMNLGPVRALVDGQTEASNELIATATSLRTLADSVDGAPADAVPTLSLPNAAVSASVGSPVSLSAVATSGSTITWDLDNDGVFDDASGANVSWTYHLAGHRVVSAKATNTAGVAVTDHALVAVTQLNLPPVISNAQPTNAESALVSTGVGTNQQFAVTATDPEGDAVRYRWFVDGEVQDGATGPTFTITPQSAFRGPHTVSVQVHDSNPGNIAEQFWRWQVNDVDADHDGWAANSVADCDDTRPAVHPGQLEVLFNQLDDDCDAATPDAPADLGTGGEVWTWGQGFGTMRGDTAIPGPNTVTDVVQLAGSFRLGYALKSDSSVVGWGMGGNGGVGISPTGAVYGLGGPSGELRGVSALTESQDVMYFLMADGHVASVGTTGGVCNSPALGAGVPLCGRNYPDYVLGPDRTGDGVADPLEGITALWNIGSTGLAQQADGTLLQWGARQCADAGWGVRPFAYAAVAEPALTAALPGLVQAAGSPNNPGSAIFRLADGRVFACGAERNGWSEFTFNRLMPFGSFGPDNPAVDVETRGNEWWVVTASGQVWVKTWNGDVLGVPGCTPTICPAGQLFQLPVAAGARIVDVDAGDDIQLRRADGTLVTWSGENTYWSVGHPTPTNPIASHIPATLEIDGYVIANHSSVWNGFALVIPTERIEASGWVPPQPDVIVSAGGATGPEGGTATATVRLSTPASGDLAVGWRFGDATGIVAVPAGETSADVTLQLPAPDGVWGIDRTQPLTITSVSANATLGDENAEITITDVDTPPTITVTPGTVPEGDANPSAAMLSVTLSRPAGVDVTATVRSGDDTAVAGVDYKPVDVQVVFPAGTTSVSIPLALIGNVVPNRDRALTLTATVSDPVGAITPATQSVTITDDDPLALRTTAVIVASGETARVTITSPAILPSEPLELAWHTVDGTARAGVDYVGSTGTLVLTPTASGGGEGTIEVPTELVPATGPDDRVRTLNVAFTAPNGERAVIGADSAMVAITRMPGVPHRQLTLTVEKSELPRGATQVVVATGFDAGEQVSFEMHSGSPISLGTATADNQGRLTKSFSIPPSAELGNHTITATGATSGSVTRAFRVVDAPPTPTNEPTPTNPPAPAGTGAPGDGLPRTGGDPTATIVTALLLVCIGAALRHRSRRRMSRQFE